ncbi:MAG: dehydrogenase [ubiquinone] 1 alpha subcomplex assembly factor 5 [Micavibrio sp.]|nr:dehydrogenase [ubiquinone] 1 alpha subcomplex assembly factor 5 [Micavibrio sp.]
MGGMFGGAQPVGEAVRGAAPRFGFLLALMRCPAEHEDNFEGRGDAAVGFGEFFLVAPCDVQKESFAGVGFVAIEDGVALAHQSQIMHQGESVFVGRGDDFGIDDREAEACALQKGPGLGFVGEGEDARAEAAAQVFLGLHHDLAQLIERLTPEHCAKEKAVRLQSLADLQQRAGQVVYRVQAETGEDGVETGGGEGQEFFVALNGGAQIFGQVHRENAADFFGLEGVRAGCTDQQGQGKFAFDQGQAVSNSAKGPLMKEIGRGGFLGVSLPGGTVAVMTHAVAVEDQNIAQFISTAACARRHL